MQMQKEYKQSFHHRLSSLRMKAISRWGFVLFLFFLPVFKRILGTGPIALSNNELAIFLTIFTVTAIVYSYLVFQPEQRLRYRLISIVTKANIIFDVFFITALIYFTGGIDSTIYSLYFFPILSSIVIFSQKEIMLNAAWIMLLYGGLITADVMEVIPHQQIWNHSPEISSVSHILIYQIVYVFFQVIIFSFIAISIQRTVEERQSNIVKEYEELKERQSHFLATAAHQLRTPLTSVKWFFTSMIEDDMDFSQQQQLLLKQAHARNNEIISLVNDLLHISELEEEETFTQESFLVTDMIGSAIHTMKQYTNEKNIDIVIDEDSERELSIIGDRKKLDVAITNIFENAIKYSPPKTSVVVRIRKKKNNCVIEIQDQGIGIPEKEIEHIFSRFFRAKNAQRYILTGSGLGLFIVQKIIQQHDGTITLRSIEGEGTTCIIELPLRPPKK